MKKRLFTFGCSFTHYCWPTWADILLTIYSGENWAKPGGGNKFIFSSLIECITQNEISKDDTVIVMWSSWAREDRYIGNNWILGGNVYNNEFYDKHFLTKYWDDKGAILDTFNWMSATYNILDRIGCEYLITSAFPFYQVKEQAEKNLVYDLIDENQFKKYFNYIDKYKERTVQDHLCQEEYYSDYIFSRTLWSSKETVDNHPLPKEHYRWLKRYILPKLNLSDEEKTLLEKNANSIHDMCIDLFNKNDRLHPTVHDYKNLNNFNNFPKRI
jgi:hypothetical protein